MTAVLEIEALGLELAGGHTILRDVDLRIGHGEAVGLVGESGSGKSMTARAVLRLLPHRARVSGAVRVDGREVGGLDRRQLRALRAGEVAMVYQDPRAHTNAVRTIGDFLTEGLRASGVGRVAALDRAAEALDAVGFPDARRRLARHPHELSGGLLQRVVIAAALLAEPKLLLADEPTTALDTTTQEEVMAVLDEQRRSRDLALLLITHDLDLAAAVSDRIAVLYAGTVVESAPAADLQADPKHPYTRGLLAARPRIDGPRRLQTIPGQPVSATEAGEGCVFASRCPHVRDVCRATRPRPEVVGTHAVACHRVHELERVAA